MLLPFRRSNRPAKSKLKKSKYRPFVKLDLVELEDRSLLTVSSSLTSGVLMVQLSNDGDAATLSRVGPIVSISDGNSSASYDVGSITSLNLVGSPQTQSVTINSDLKLLGTFTSLGVENVAFADNVSFGARSTAVSNSLAIAGADKVTIGAGATLFTRATAGSDPLNDLSTANSGGLSFAAKSIIVGAGTRILTHADNGFQAGDIVLSASDKRTDTYMIPLFNQKQAIVSLDVADNVVIQGRNITLSTEAESTRLTLFELGSLVSGSPSLPSKTVNTGVTFTPGLVDGSEGPTISRNVGSWATDGFSKETTIYVTGTPNGTNDGSYDVDSVSGDGKSLVLIASNALRSQVVPSGTDVKISQVRTDLAAGDVPFVAVDKNGNPVAGQQKQSDITANAQPPVGWNPALNFLEGLPSPLQVSLTQVYAKTTIGSGVSIIASGNVTVSSSASGTSQTDLPSLVFGVTWAESDVQSITKIGNATITAAGSFSATSAVENSLSAAVTALGGSVQNPAGGDPVKIPGPSISVAVARGNSVSIAETSDGTIITANGVTVDAAMENSFAAESSSTTANASSLAGSVGVTIANHSAQAAATLRGRITSNGDVEVKSNAENSAIETRAEASVNAEEEPDAASPMFGTFTAISKFLSQSKDKQDDKSKNEQSQEGESGTSFQIAGAVVIAFSSLTSEASIGNNAVVIVTDGSLTVSSESSNAPQSSAVGSAEANSKLAVGGAFVYADYTQNAKAWVGDNATLNVDNDISVTAASSEVGGFPTSFGDFIGGLLGFRDTGLPWVGDGSVTNFEGAVSRSGDFADAASELLGRGKAIAEGDWSSLLQEFGTSFVSASAQPGEVRDKDGKTSSKSNAASGNFDMVFTQNHATAWIGEGVKINQNTPNGAVDQSVTVEATTEAKALYFGGLTGQGNPFGYTTVGGNGAIGGVYAHHDHDTNATAFIADGVQIQAKGDVTVNAENNLIVGVWDFAGSSGKNFAVQGTFTVTPVDSVSIAYIENSAVIDAGRDLAVTATTDNLLITFTGAIAKSDKVGVGAGLGYFNVDTTTKAFIGNVTDSGTFADKGTITVGGDVNVAAQTDTLGVVIAISSALSTNPSAEPPAPPVDDDPLDGISLPNLFADPDQTDPTNTDGKGSGEQSAGAKGVTGFGLSASLGLNLFDTVTYAGIDGMTVTADGNLNVTAKSDELYIVATGAASVNLNTEADSSTAIAGALSWNDLNRSVTANINNSAISAGNVTIAADAKNLLVSLTAGAAVTSPTQKSRTSIGFAGSANINNIDTTVSATVTGKSSITSSGSVSVTADHSATIVSIAGAVGVSQRAGIGAAFDLGLFDTSVEARLADEVVVSATKDVTISAANDARFVSIAASIGVGSDKFAIAGSASWTNDTTTVNATIGNKAKVTAGGDVKVLADENLTIFGLGGAAGIGKESGFGAGIAGINLQRTVNASIGNNATISVGGSMAAGEHGLFVQATTDDDLYLFGAGGAVAANRAAVAGSLALLIDSTTTNASIGNATSVSQPAALNNQNMSVYVLADHDSTIVAVAGALAVSKSAGVGFGVVVMPIAHTVTASIASSAKISANNDIHVRANHDFEAYTIAAALGVAKGGVGVAGAGVIQPLSFTTTATVGSAAVLRANGNIVVTADSNYDMIGIAGQGTLGVGSAGVGVSNVTTVRNETVKAEVGNYASLTALGNKGTFAATNENSTTKAVRGVIVTSTLNDDTVLVAAGAAGGTGNIGAAGSATVTIQTTNVTARIGTGVTVTPNAADRTAANAAQAVYLYAEQMSDFASAGGAAGFGSTGGVGVGIDVGTINRTTRAIIDNSANVYARGDVSARTAAGGDWISVAASVGVGNTAGVAGAASIQVHTITTQARIGDNATVYAGGNIVVTAKDDLQIDSIAGQISGGGTAGVGGSIPVAVVVKTTDASVGNSAIVDALGNTTGFAAIVGAPTVSYTNPLFFGTSAVNTSAKTINLGYNHGFQTGDQVTYWANSTPIGGLENNGSYFVIYVNDMTIKLAETKSEALAGTALTLTSQGSGAQQSITLYGSVAAPAVNNSDASTQALTNTRSLSFGTTDVRGLVVSAISIDDYATYGISGGAAGTAAVQIVGSVSVPTINTTATIGADAKVNQNDLGANAAQSVIVAAVADYTRLGIGGSVAIAGTAGVAPLADVLVSTHVTRATIGDRAKVGAEADVVVSAEATEDIKSFVIGVAGGGEAAVAGSVGVVVLDTATQAIVGNSSTVAAGSNVIVSAKDDTEALVVIGSAALGLGGAGVGASVNVSVIEKDTKALIGDNASVSAQALGGSTTAYNGDGFSKVSAQGVIVQAVSSENILNVVVAGGGGFYAGVAGAVNVNVLTANTTAQLGNGVTINGLANADTDQSVIVAAIDSLDLNVVAGSVGGAVGAGVAGSVDVGVIRSNTNATVGTNAKVNATKDISIGAASTRDVDAVIVSGAGGIGSLAAAVGVYSLYATVDSDSNKALNGNSSNAGTYADSATNTSTFSSGLGSYNQTSSTQSGKGIASAGNSAGGTIAAASPNGVVANALKATVTPSGTSAVVGNGATLNSKGSISVLASDTVEIDVTTGGISGGAAGGIGAAVTYVTVGGQSLARVGDSTTLSGTTIEVSAGYDGDATSKAYGGGVSGFVGLGAQVAVVNDAHLETAHIGNNATINATNKLSILTDGKRELTTQNAGGAGSLGVAGGASYAKVNSSGISRADLGSGGNVTVGSGGVQIASNATSTANVTAVGVAAGSAAINLTLANMNLNAQSHASVGAGTNITSAGNVAVTATYKSSVDLDAVGVTGGSFSVGAIDIRFQDTSNVSASLNKVGKFDIKGDLSVLASSDNAVDTNVVGTSVGGLGGNGAGVTVTANPTVSASTSSTDGLTAAGSISVIGRAGGEFDAKTTGVSVGGVAVGVSVVSVNWSPTVTASVGAGTTMAAGGDLIVRSLVNYDAAGVVQTGKTVDIGVTAVAGGLIAGSASVVGVSLKTTTATTIGAGASLSATNQLRIGSDQFTRTNVNLTAVNGGFVAGGAVYGDVNVHASSTVTLPDSLVSSPTRISGGQGVAVKAGIDHGGRANIKGGAGGLYGAIAGSRFNFMFSGPDTSSNTDYVPVTVLIGANSVISSAGLTDIGTFHRIDFESDSFLAGFGGLLGGVSNNLTTESRIYSAVTIGANSKIGTRNLRISTDQNVRSDTDTDAQAYAGLTASTQTNSASRYYATNNVTVNTGTVIVATGAATIENANGNVYVRADSYARGVSFIATVNADSYGTRQMNNNILINPGTQIITPRLAVQSLRPTGSLDVHADSTNASSVGFFISIWNAITGGDVGRVAHYDGNVGTDTVNLNADITLGSPRDVKLSIDANGSITEQNWPTAVIEPTRIVVDDIFTAQPERLDVRAPNGTTTGKSTVTYGLMESVTIDNASKRTLVLRNIDTFSAGLNAPIYNHEGQTRNWSYTESKSTTTNGENAKVTIRNTAVGTDYDVQLAGRIDVVAGSVNITANGGDIFSQGPGGYINSRAVTLNATAGALGTTTNALFIRTPEQTNATLPVGIQSAHGETGGYLDVSVTSPTASSFTYGIHNVTSNTGTMKIVANEGSQVTRGITTEVQLTNGTSYQGNILGQLAFDPWNSAQFNAKADTITLPYAHGLKTGDKVTYQPVGATPIGGIVPWIEREVKVISDTTIQFSTGFNTTNVSTAMDSVTFAAPHGIQTGEAVVYDNNGGTTIGGLTNGSTYYAWSPNDTTVQLYDTQAHANTPSVSFRPNTIQHIQNPNFDSKATSGIASLEYLDVIAVSDSYDFTTGTKFEYWTNDTNSIRRWTDTTNDYKYWTNTLNYADGSTDPNDTSYSKVAANDSKNFVNLPSMGYFYAVKIAAPAGADDATKAMYASLVGLSMTKSDATDGVLMKLSTPASNSQELHFLRPTTGLINITSAPGNQSQAFRADLVAPSKTGGLHIIDTNSIYVQDSKGSIVRVSRDNVRSIRDVVAESLTVPTGTTTTVELGSITSTAGNIDIQAGTNSSYATQVSIVDTISAVAGTVKIEAKGGSIANNATTTNIVANLADLTTWNDIGSESSPITGKVQNLTAVAGTSGKTGGIWFENTGKLTLQGLTAINNISVTVIDQVSAGDDLYVDANSVITSTAGQVDLKAGDQLIIPTSASVNGANGVNLYINYGNAEGTSGVIDLRGFQSKNVVNIYGNANTIDTIFDINNMDYEIGDNYLRRYRDYQLDTEFKLFNVTGDHFDITTGSLDNSITVTDWTGTGRLDGGAGFNKLVAVNDADFTLGDTTLSRTGHGDITFVDNSIRFVRLVGGASDNRFTVTNWTGQASLDGADGTDTIIDSNDVDYSLDDTYLSRSTPGSFDLWSFERAELTTGALDNRFEISAWSGETILDGGAGFNTVASVRDGDYDLSDSSLVRTVAGKTAGKFDLSNFTNSLLIGGQSDNTFTVSGWTGQAALDGKTGIDTVVSTVDANAYLTNDFLARGDGGQFSLSNLDSAVIRGGAGSNSFLIEGWNGAVSVDGMGGGDDLTVNANTDYTLTASSIKLANGTNIDVANLTQVMLNGGDEDNIFTIEEQPDFFTVIHGFGGNNKVSVSADNDFILTESNLALGGKDSYFFDQISSISLIGSQRDNDFLIEGWGGDVAVHGNDGNDTVRVVADTDFSLIAGAINLGTGKTVNLFDIDNVKLYGGASDNRFSIGDWKGSATLYGGAGQDVVSALVSDNVTLTDGKLSIQDGATVGLVDVERAVLIGMPGRDHVFVIQDYTGEASVQGSADRFNLLTVLSSGAFSLQTGHLVLGTGGTINFSNIDSTVLQGATDVENQFTIGAGTGDVSIVGGNTGMDEITVVADTDFILDDSVVQLGDDTRIHLTNVSKAHLVGGVGDNNFDVSGWTGYASLDGLDGNDTVVSTNDTDFVLTSDTLQRGDGASFGLFNIEAVSLTGGASANRFNVEGRAGQVNLDGGEGSDDYVVVLDGDSALSVVIDDTGFTGTDTLSVVVPAGPRPFVTMHGVWLDDEEILFDGIEDFILL